MTTAGLILKIVVRRSRSFAPGRAAARLRCPRCRWRGVSETWMKRLPSQRAPPAFSKAIARSDTRFVPKRTLQIPAPPERLCRSIAQQSSPPTNLKRQPCLSYHPNATVPIRRPAGDNSEAAVSTHIPSLVAMLTPYLYLRCRLGRVLGGGEGEDKGRVHERAYQKSDVAYYPHPH